MIGNIFEEMDRMERELNLFCSGNQCVALVPKAKETGHISRLPVADLYETESSVIAAFELPGVEKEEIQLDVTEDRIEVKVEQKAEKESEGKEAHSYETKRNSFYGALPMPKGVVAENAEASYRNGILRIEIPKAKKQDSRKRIEIK